MPSRGYCAGGLHPVIFGEPDGYYHHYPSVPQVRAWLAGAGFMVAEGAEGPWQVEEYAYRHVLARLEARRTKTTFRSPWGI